MWNHLRPTSSSLKCTLSLSVSWSINQSFSQSSPQSINQLINQSIRHQSVNQVHSQYLSSAKTIISQLISTISTCLTEHLHWLPLTAGIQFKILFLIYRVLLGQALTYLCDSIRQPVLVAASLYPLCSLAWLDICVPHSRTAMVQHRAFSCIGSSLWNDLLQQFVTPSVLRALLRSVTRLKFKRRQSLPAILVGSTRNTSNKI